MELQKLYDEVVGFAKECGMVQKTHNDPKGNTIVRDNATGKQEKEVDFKKGAYFGFIREEEDYSGGYHDFSLVFFPQIDCKACVVALGVGSLGFANDYDLASLPWIRRLFTRLRKIEVKSFFKNDFSDIEMPAADLAYEIKTKYPLLKDVIDKYKVFLPASQILDFSDTTKDDDNLLIAKQWVATYATLRSWAGNADNRKSISRFLPKVSEGVLTTNKIYDILLKDRYIVLQGAPGTGKTWSAMQVASEFEPHNVLFEQFHAETTYSDFIYGITPVLNSQNIAYQAREGVLYKAIKLAQNTNDSILLIIDEINRANLSNVLGPVFYLFEKNQQNRKCQLTIGDIKISSLPKNLFVIATMNTADRSLAVVDFALRRRFTWLTIKPHVLNDSTFQKEYFEKFEELFQKYATDDELNLQPGHSYFLATNKDMMKERLQFELMPLMKEYFNEGYLTKAKDEFCNFFYNELGVLMYE